MVLLEGTHDPHKHLKRQLRFGPFDSLSSLTEDQPEQEVNGQHGV